MSTKKLLRLTKPLALALAKGAHRKEMSQQRFMEEALAAALVKLDDEKIQDLVSEHDLIVESRTPNQEESDNA